ncbi:MAG TPA: hypothetical protein VGD49_03890 [Longimicrobiales bacterium]
MMRVRRGSALIEALLASVLLVLVAATAATVLRTQSRIASDISLRGERNDAARSALLTLQAELQSIDPRPDLHAVGRDSIATRLFRGIAIVCGARDSITFARYRGLRLPDATKDSALQLGVENVVAVQTAATSAQTCFPAPDEQVLALNLGILPPPNSTWLIFETGAYHLSTNALRYRRGAESRQPITSEIIDDRHSSFRGMGDTSFRAIEVVLKDRRTNARAQATIGFANAR